MNFKNTPAKTGVFANMREMFHPLGEPGTDNDARFQPPAETQAPVEIDLADTFELRQIREKLEAFFDELAAPLPYGPEEKRRTVEAILRKFRREKNIDLDPTLEVLGIYVKEILMDLRKKKN